MKKRSPVFYLTAYCLIVSVISFINCSYPDVWFFEIYTGFIGLALLIFTYRRFRFSNLVYVLVAIHFTVLAVGAHYTYAEMPLFDWLKEVLGFSRNHFDRVGHFFQGFVPVIVTREILIRIAKFRKGGFLNTMLASFCLAVSAFWEILEAWVVILFYKSAGPEWLGWQGDIWDAQNDMTMCFTGSVLALIFLSKLHDKSMAKAMKKRK